MDLVFWSNHELLYMLQQVSDAQDVPGIEHIVAFPEEFPGILYQVHRVSWSYMTARTVVTIDMDVFKVAAAPTCDTQGA